MKRAAIVAGCVMLASFVLAGCTWGGDDEDGAPSAEPAATTSDGAPAVTIAPSSVTPAPTASATRTATATPSPTPSATPEEGETGSALSQPTAIQRAYLDAIEARDAGDLDAAERGFARVLANGGPLAPVARFRRAQVLAQAERDGAAAVVFGAALADPELPSALLTVGRFEYSDVLLRLGRTAEAVAALEAVVAAAPTSADLAEAQLRLASLRIEAGDPAWADNARAAMEAAPGGAASVAALDALEAEGVEVPLGQAAFVRYRSFDNETAAELYEELAATAPTGADAAVAWFYLGALAERRLDNAAAIDAYEQSLAFDATGYLADDAHWWLALLYEDEGEPLAAAAHYDALRTTFPGSPFAVDASLRLGVALARGGRAAPAAAELRGVMGQGAPSQAAAAARWLELLGLASEEDPGPATYDPTALPSLLADAGAQVFGSAGLGDAWAIPEADWAEAEAWLKARYGPAPSEPASTGSADYALALELAVVREEGLARGLLFGLLQTYRDEPHELVALARGASTAGMYDVALFAAVRVLGELPPEERLAAPVALELLAYPAPFVEELEAAAEAEGLPPLLLLALVRQESAFDPQAGSTAGAMGLTQVIAPTGAQIAASLGVEWDVASLFEPATSLRFGAHYLSAQLEEFDDDLLAALAAYNGGPHNAVRWLEAHESGSAGGVVGPDAFVEAVDFVETRAYLERVVENYAWYRYLYAGAAVPALP